MDSCEVCKIIKGQEEGIHSKPYILKLKGGWVLNHYGEPTRSYLGYLVLTTKQHVPDFDELSLEEARTLGVHLRCVNKVLREYWKSSFPNDPIQRVYTVYFNETPYIKHLKGNAVSDASHVHMHIMPRTKKMGEICNAQKLGWEFINTIGCFPKYVLCGVEKKIALMEYLRMHLSSQE